MNVRKILTKVTICLSIGLVTLSVTEAAVKFAREYTYQGFQKKDSTWISIAERAEGTASACQTDLAAARDARDQANKDILQ